MLVRARSRDESPSVSRRAVCFVMCVMHFSRVGAPSEIRSCCLFRSREVRESQLSGHAFQGDPSNAVHGRRGRRAPSPPARGTVRESAGRAWPAARDFSGGVQIFSGEIPEFFQEEFGMFPKSIFWGGMRPRPRHLENSEIRNFSRMSLEFFQTFSGIFPKGVRNFSYEISDFV